MWRFTWLSQLVDADKDPTVQKVTHSSPQMSAMLRLGNSILSHHLRLVLLSGLGEVPCGQDPRQSFLGGKKGKRRGEEESSWGPSKDAQPVPFPFATLEVSELGPAHQMPRAAGTLVVPACTRSGPLFYSGTSRSI